ncbi:MAG: hypothetical protein CME67_01685 [Halobacteriovoraceae bacterium]|nr:hypothetical protein [Halobacteriovoraceae bacterium]|tara:strand:+ start:148 stop:393 length:246 start_codon:yes stop_codon:yes gene_type:complete
MKKKRFISIKNQQGIRKDLVTGKYIARKYVSGKEYSATKSKLIDAIEYRRNFYPLLTNCVEILRYFKRVPPILVEEDLPKV